MPPHQDLSSIGKLSMSSVLGGFLMFRPGAEQTVETLILPVKRKP
jgi:hypothetical protein